MSALMIFVITIIVVSLIFDFVNGFHDAANSIATVVSTRVLSPGVAVVWAAFFNFIAFVIFGTKVASTIGKGMLNLQLIDPQWQLWTIFCGALGAIIWNLITWYFGLPSSSSHALIGGLAGSAVAAHNGFEGLFIKEGWIKTVSFIFISPLVGMILGFLLMVAILWIFHRTTPDKVDKLFRRLQLFSAAFFSLGHGGNDAQKTMGIIAAVLVAANINPTATKDVPLWVVLICHAAIGLGTLSGGWRIVHTMGSRITKLRPVNGFAAETAGSIAIAASTYGGIPVSTTHTITGGIMGVGATRRLSAVRWGVARSVVWAWILTIPMAGIIAALAFYVVKLFSTFTQ